jgi:DNA polymerase-3 subunit delta'
MRWDVASVFLKILEEPPGSATLILTAPSPYSLLPTIVSRCLQFHFAPLPASEVEAILKTKSQLSPNAAHLAAQLSEGRPGYALEMDALKESERRSNGLKILARAARGEEFAQLFALTNAISKDREVSFEEQLSVFYSLLCDLLELSSGIPSPQLRNLPLRKDLDAVAKQIDIRWVMRALRGLDQVAAGARRNLNRQLGLDAFAAELSPALSSRK